MRETAIAHAERRPQQLAPEWPEGVIARYLTVGGATVDLMRTNDPAAESATPWDATRAHCAGCGTREAESWGTRPHGTLISITGAERFATRAVRNWAQEHAEQCRAMPRPETGER